MGDLSNISAHGMAPAFEVMPDGVYLVDAECNLLYANPALQEDFGPRDGRKCYEYFQQRGDACPWCKRREAFAGKAVRWRWNSDRNDKTYDRIDSPVSDGAGGVLKLSILRDVTDIERAEESLRRGEQQFRELYERAPLGYQSLDEEGRFITVNQAWVDTLGYGREEVVGRWFGDFLTPPYREAFARGFPCFKKEGAVRGVESEMVRKDGAHIIVAFDGRIGRDAEGNFKQTHCILKDITAQRRAEAERQEFQAQLQRTQKLESLGALAGGIAHDFNNLLMVILGNADMALMDLPDQAPARPSVEEIKKASRRAADLTNQMLAYAGKGRYVVQPIDLNELVREMTHLLQASMSKKIVLRIEPADGLPPVKADAAQMQQTVMNLLTNAAEAIDADPGVIVLRTGVVHVDQAGLAETYLKDDIPEGRYVYLEVTDTGCGMDDQVRARLFDPFFSTKFTGRGLGLAAVLGIVKSHRGAIKVDTELGKGTTFRVLLPCMAPSADEAPAPDHADADEAWRGSGTILIVDDEPAVRNIAETMLRRAGFSVLTAADGQEGVDLFGDRADEIAAVLLDVTMSKLSGHEVFARIRQVRPDAVVLLCSGYTEKYATARFDTEGLAGFLQKPFRSDALIAKLREVLEA